MGITTNTTEDEEKGKRFVTLVKQRCCSIDLYQQSILYPVHVSFCFSCVTL